MYFTRNKQANFDTFLSSVMAFSVLYGNKSLGRQLLGEALKKKGRVFYKRNFWDVVFRLNFFEVKSLQDMFI